MKIPLQITQRLNATIDKLREKVLHEPKFSASDYAKISQAISMGKAWHSGQFRDTGDLYYIHPVRVAIGTLQYIADPVMVNAALLHDVLEDTDAKFDDIASALGEEVAFIVKALTRFKKEERALSAERIFQLAKKDCRVLLIKMLDRIDNLEDIHLLTRKRQRSNAQESMIFSTVSEGLGLEEIAQSFRNKAFQILYPLRYNKISQELQAIQKTNKPLYQLIANDLWQTAGTEFCKNVTIELKRPFDFAPPKAVIMNVLKNFTLTVETTLNCYYALGLLHSAFPVVPYRFRDYIANPLANGWKGLETTLLVRGLTVQVLITTATFDSQNRRGVFNLLDDNNYNGEVYAKFIEQFGSLFSEKNIDLGQVFQGNTGQLSVAEYIVRDDRFFQVSTPNGHIIQLNAGATALDFAYCIHTEIGQTCVGAVVNEYYRVDPSYRLQEGNVIEIITDKNVHPQKSWLNIVTTPHARKEVLSFLKKAEKKQQKPNEKK